MRCSVCAKEVDRWLESSNGEIFCSEKCFQETWLKCAICRKPMDSWIEADNGEKYCSEKCYQTTWHKCAVCGKSMDNWIESENGEKYCSDLCYKKSWPKCCVCGKAIDSWVEDENGKKYCSDQCYQTSLPRCEACHAPMDHWVESSDGHKYCSEKCYQTTWPTCSICGKPMDHWITDQEGKKYCSDKCYEKTWPSCTVCGKPMHDWIEDVHGNKFCSDECHNQTLQHCAHCGHPMKTWIETEQGNRYCSNACLAATTEPLTLNELAYAVGLSAGSCATLLDQTHWNTDEALENIYAYMESLNGHITIEASLIEAIRNAGVYNQLAQNLASYNTLRGGAGGFKGFVFEELHAANAAVKGTPIRVLGNNSLADFATLKADGTLQYAQAKAGYAGQTVDWTPYKGQTIIVDKGNTALANQARKAGLEVIESDVTLAETQKLTKWMQTESRIMGKTNSTLASKAYSVNQAGIQSAKFAAKIGIGFNIGSNIFDVMDGEKDIAEAAVDAVVDTATLVGGAYLGGAAMTTLAGAGTALANTAAGGAIVAAGSAAGTVFAGTAAGGAVVATGTAVLTTIGSIGAVVASAPLLPIAAAGAAVGFVYKGLKKLFS